MEVLKRSQITEVITKRLVFHVLELNGVKYGRVEKLSTFIPYMDCDLVEPTIEIHWNRYVGERTSEKLYKKEVKELKLEELFFEIDKNSRNGNG